MAQKLKLYKSGNAYEEGIAVAIPTKTSTVEKPQYIKAIMMETPDGMKPVTIYSEQKQYVAGDFVVKADTRYTIGYALGVIDEITTKTGETMLGPVFLKKDTISCKGMDKQECVGDECTWVDRGDKGTSYCKKSSTQVTAEKKNVISSTNYDVSGFCKQFAGQQETCAAYKPLCNWRSPGSCIKGTGAKAVEMAEEYYKQGKFINSKSTPTSIASVAPALAATPALATPASPATKKLQAKPQKETIDCDYKYSKPSADMLRDDKMFVLLYSLYTNYDYLGLVRERWLKRLLRGIADNIESPDSANFNTDMDRLLRDKFEDITEDDIKKTISMISTYFDKI